MPLFIIAIVFLIGLLIYVIVGFKISNTDNIPVRQRFPDKFPRRKTDVDFTVEVEEDKDIPQEENK